MACILIVGDTGTSAHLIERMREILDSTSSLDTIIATNEPAIMEIKRVEYTIEAPELELPVWERKRDFVAYGGKIRMVWDNWYEKYILWEPAPVAQGKCIIFNKRFRRRFQGFNHGRHRDRKRR